MAETRQTQQAEAPQPAPRPCPQDCSLCSISQQVFCCTRMLFDLSRAQMETRRQVGAVEHAIADIRAQLQSGGGAQLLSVPLVEQEDTAQQGGGAKE